MASFLAFFSLTLILIIVESSGSPVPEANHGYRPPSYRPRYRKGPTHTHHHYYHRGAPKEYVRPLERPSYKPSYHSPPAYPDYAAPARRPIRYAPNYDYDYDFQEPRPRNPIHTSGEDPWLHIHKEEAARSALLFGVGVVKGVALTALVNSGNNGVTIGK